MHIQDMGSILDPDELVCSDCFANDDLKHFIEKRADIDTCFFCGKKAVSTISFKQVLTHIFDRINEFYDQVDNALPYTEGSYLGKVTDSYDFRWEIGPSSAIESQVVSFLSDMQWGERDWGGWDNSKQLENKWTEFADEVKFTRRFFFHQLGKTTTNSKLSHLSYEQFLSNVCSIIESINLIVTEPTGYSVFRCRRREAGKQFTKAKELGTSPVESSLQFNRMNPPGIPMFYGSSNEALAIKEAREKLTSLGQFEALKPIKLLDLSNVGIEPGLFSEVSRASVLEWRFLRNFSTLICEPVEKSKVTKLEYIPTQIFTEFLKDYPFANGPIDGIRYKSATATHGTNVALFATNDEMIDYGESSLINSQSSNNQLPTPWLMLSQAKAIESFDLE